MANMLSRKQSLKGNDMPRPVMQSWQLLQRHSTPAAQQRRSARAFARGRSIATPGITMAPAIAISDAVSNTAELQAPGPTLDQRSHSREPAGAQLHDQATAPHSMPLDASCAALLQRVTDCETLLAHPTSTSSANAPRRRRRSSEEVRRAALQALPPQVREPLSITPAERVQLRTKPLWYRERVKRRHKRAWRALLRLHDPDKAASRFWESCNLSAAETSGLVLRCQARMLPLQIMSPQRLDACLSVLTDALGDAQQARALLRRAPRICRLAPRRLQYNLLGLRAASPEFRQLLQAQPLLCTGSARNVTAVLQLAQALMGQHAGLKAVHQCPNVLLMRLDAVQASYTELRKWVRVLLSDTCMRRHSCIVAWHACECQG